MLKLQLTPDQSKVHDAVMDWHEDQDDLITVGGFAGTGKTTLLGEITGSIKDKWPETKIAYCCYTGKASQVLNSKVTLGSLDYCGTIHRLIYEPELNKSRKIVRWNRVDAIDFHLIVLDEASMVSEKIFRDLSSYAIPILAVGDHGQLPPIEGKFNLMEKPMHRLEKIHRQAEDNPIIKLSLEIRNSGRVSVGDYSTAAYAVKKVIGMQNFKIPIWMNDPLILCGMNHTRVRLNRTMRSMLGFSGTDPLPGEKVICIKNNADIGIYNGMIGTIASIAPSGEHWYVAEVDFPDFQYRGRILKHQFGQRYKLEYWEQLSPWKFDDMFDFGYCITVHKAQGSESESVILIEERNKYMTDDKWRRWLYTAVTRARTNLLIIEP